MQSELWPGPATCSRCWRLLALPIVFNSAKRTQQRITTLACYYAGSIWPIMPGATQFFGNEALLHPLVYRDSVAHIHGGSHASVDMAVRCATACKAEWALPIGLSITALLPTGVVNPLTVAGVLFPGLGWAGLVATIILFGTLARFRFYSVAIDGDALGNMLCLSSRNSRRTVNMARPRHRTWRFRTIQTNANGAL